VVTSAVAEVTNLNQDLTPFFLLSTNRHSTLYSWTFAVQR
jgi:hypothetical protein